MAEASAERRYERAAALLRRRERLAGVLERLEGVLRATHAAPRLVLARHPVKERFDAFWLVARPRGRLGAAAGRVGADRTHRTAALDHPPAAPWSPRTRSTRCASWPAGWPTTSRPSWRSTRRPRRRSCCASCPRLAPLAALPLALSPARLAVDRAMERALASPPLALELGLVEQRHLGVAAPRAGPRAAGPACRSAARRRAASAARGARSRDARGRRPRGWAASAGAPRPAARSRASTCPRRSFRAAPPCGAGASSSRTASRPCPAGALTASAGTPSSPLSSSAATAAGSSARSALVRSTTASTPPRALTARKRASRRGLRSRLSDVATQREVHVGREHLRAPARRDAARSRRGAAAPRAPGRREDRHEVAGGGHRAAPRGGRRAARSIGARRCRRSRDRGRRRSRARPRARGRRARRGLSAAPRASRGARGDGLHERRLLFGMRRHPGPRPRRSGPGPRGRRRRGGAVKRGSAEASAAQISAPAYPASAARSAASSRSAGACRRRTAWWRSRRSGRARLSRPAPRGRARDHRRRSAGSVPSPCRARCGDLYLDLVHARHCSRRCSGRAVRTSRGTRGGAVAPLRGALPPAPAGSRARQRGRGGGADRRARGCGSEPLAAGLGDQRPAHRAVGGERRAGLPAGARGAPGRFVATTCLAR